MSPDLIGGIRLGQRRVFRPVASNELADSAQRLLGAGYRLALVSAHHDGPMMRVVYLFLAGSPDRREELHLRVPTENPTVPSLADVSFPAGRFEREMADLYGITPIGHPAPRRLVKHAHWPEDWHPMRRDAVTPPHFSDTSGYPFVPVRGAGVYEIPVGPVHAGLIEPGHFRFSVVGETILKLTARLWFSHRGVEKLFEGRDAFDSVDLAERISGDSAAAHALAHALAVEDALGITVPDSVQNLRALLVELERLYNHVSDLGALANDVGYSLPNAHALRVREQLLRSNEATTGHRLLRGGTRVGGARLLALPDSGKLEALAADVAEIADLTLANSVVRDRFTGTAALSRDDAHYLGCLGVVARASGLEIDARLDHPVADLPVHTIPSTDGDVLARYTVRRDEFGASAELASRLIHSADEISPSDVGAARRSTSSRSGVGVVEGWRGTIVHRVEIDEHNRITRAKIVDPSWFNWPALPVAMADTIVPDFPLANKSFNLSYAANDL